MDTIHDDQGDGEQAAHRYGRGGGGAIHSPTGYQGQIEDEIGHNNHHAEPEPDFLLAGHNQNHAGRAGDDIDELSQGQDEQGGCPTGILTSK